MTGGRIPRFAELDRLIAEENAREAQRSIAKTERIKGNIGGAGVHGATNSKHSLDSSPTGGTVNLKPNGSISPLFSIDAPYFDSPEVAE